VFHGKKRSSRLRALLLVLLVFQIAFLSTCKDAFDPPQSDAKTITSFSFDGLTVRGSIDAQGNSIKVIVPFGTDLSSLVPTIIHTGASISPPSGSAHDFRSEVTYTVTAENGSTQDYAVSVTAAPNLSGDKEAVEADAASLAPGWAEGESASKVTHDIILRGVGPMGSSISWATDEPTVIDASGKVARPPVDDAQVVLTATLTKGGQSATRTFTIHVLHVPATNAEAVAQDASLLFIRYHSGDSAASVSYPVSLPASGTNGSVVTWNCYADVLAVNSGNVDGFFTTTRDSITENLMIDLFATLTRGGATTTINFTLSLVPRADEIAVGLEVNALVLALANGDSRTRVTKNIPLPDHSPGGMPVTWVCSLPEVVGPTGMVTRPASSAADARVVLTASASSGEATAKRRFGLIVAAEDGVQPIAAFSALVSSVSYDPAMEAYKIGVTLDASASYHPNPMDGIVRYEWDFSCDSLYYGSYNMIDTYFQSDALGKTVFHYYLSAYLPVTFFVALRVTDSGYRVRYECKELVIPHP
jgi:hypothetical protein